MFNVTADDFPGLGQVHSLIESFAAALPRSESWTDAAGQLSDSARGLVEKIILRDVSDVEDSLRQLGQTTEEILKLIPGESPGSDLVSVEESKSDGDAPTEVASDLIDPQDAGLVCDFILEAREHIESSEAALLILDQSPGDLDAINALFRAFHTIKGVAGFLKLGQIGALAHAVESLMDLARSQSICLTTKSIDALLRSVDLMKIMLNAVEEAVKAATSPPDQAALAPIIRALQDCAQPGVDVSRSEQHSERETLPPVEAANDAPPTVPATQVSAAVASAGQEVPPASPMRNAVPPTNAAPATNAAAGADAVVKVTTKRLDSLVDAIGELVIAQTMVRQDVAAMAPPNHRVLRTINQVSKIARELQELSMSMRMVPIQGVFQKMSRLARDLSQKSGKDFELEVIGGDTELDRGLVETISDPLVHMVRNSADHGIESAHDRELAGKPRAGRIQLRAYHQAGNVVVEVSDDGRGLNKARILKKAQERGIVPAGKELSEQEIYKLIFAAGLSTAEAVTDVSGRGVGMDVVLRNVESLRGRIDIASKEGSGSTFTIRLPLTLAVIDGLVVRVGTERYVIPISSIEQSLRPTAGQVFTLQGRGEMCMVRDQLVPIVRIHTLFGVEPTQHDPNEALLVIVQCGSTRCCLMVDELLGQQQVVIKSLGGGVGQTKGVSGGAILGDGNVSLILDVPGIIAVSGAD
ncbi:MAG TPA: chemotaxis protein CheA [Tepidisphaeraceae bacterium]|nr:chemotaxis protein CheA [Tepidisphaeraceae bacterium]